MIFDVVCESRAEKPVCVRAFTRTLNDLAQIKKVCFDFEFSISSTAKYDSADAFRSSQPH